MIKGSLDGIIKDQLWQWYTAVKASGRLPTR